MPVPYTRAVRSAIIIFAKGVAPQWYPVHHNLWAFLLSIVVYDQWTGLHESGNRRFRCHNKVDLPDGVQQIGLGIGYTCARPSRFAEPADKDGSGPSTAMTPRALRSVGRSLSLGSSVVRCGALLSHIPHIRPRAKAPSSAAQEGTGREAERASEESDAMEAVMREMYGAAWNPEFGVGYLGGAAVSSRRRAGRVYSVEEGEEAVGSTVRLVQAHDVVRDPVQ